MRTRIYAIVFAGLAASLSQATMLLPGGSVGRGTTQSPGQLSAFIEIGTLIDQTVQTFNNASITGTVISSVYRNSGGLLDFAFQVHLDQSSNPVHRVSLYNFGLFSTDVGYSLTPLAPYPGIGTIMANEANRSVDGTVVGWDYDAGATGLNPGSTTFAMIVKTNASAYRPGNVGIIDGVTANVNGFAPVPEPASLAVISIGALGVLRRRKTSK